MNNSGFGIDMKITDKGTETKLYGQGVDNLKRQIKDELIEEIQEEIIKPENERIHKELESLKTAILTKDKSLLRKTLETLIKKGAPLAIEILIKIILNRGCV